MTLEEKEALDRIVAETHEVKSYLQIIDGMSHLLDKLRTDILDRNDRYVQLEWKLTKLQGEKNV